MYPRISYTTMKAYEECHLRHQLHRQRKRKRIPQEYVLVGSVIHYVAEQWLLRASSIEGMVADALRDFDRRVAEEEVPPWTPEDTEMHRERTKVGAERLIELMGEEFRSVAAGNLQSEMHILKFYDSWMLEAYIDVINVTPNMRPIAVYDVKTGTSHHQDQLTFYGVVCEQYMGDRPEKYAWIEPLGRGVVYVSITEDEHEEMKRRIGRAVLAIAADEFQPTGFPSKCSRCPSKTMCPATEASREMRFE